MGDGSGGFRPNGQGAYYCHEIPLSIDRQLCCLFGFNYLVCKGFWG